MSGPRRPSPVVTEDSEPFWTAAAEGRLVVQRCSGCGRFNHPPRPMCPGCGSLEHAWPEVSGRGTVYSFSVIHHPQNAAFDYPVVAVLVDLDEGVRLLANLVDVRPADVRIGLTVKVDFAPTAHGGGVPVFRPAGDR